MFARIFFVLALAGASENIGDTDAHGILVELKQAPPAAARVADPLTFIRGAPGKESCASKSGAMPPRSRRTSRHRT